MERDEKGRFLPGQKMKPGPGRPPKAVEREYLETTIRRVSLRRWGEVVDKALDDAVSGDGVARKWLSEYLMGRPPQILELRGAEAHLLAELIEHARRIGRTPAELFEAMIAEFAQLDVEGGNDDSE